VKKGTKLANALTVAAFMAAVFTPVLGINAAQAEGVVVGRKCINSTCGKATFRYGKVTIKVESKLSRTTHFNFKGVPGDQIELGPNGIYKFERDPGESGEYDVQACDRGGIGARSTCTKWARYQWSTGAQEEMEEQ
jgi:hypothetical protein